MGLHGRNILGADLSAAGKQTLRATNPASGTPLEPPYYEATEQEIEIAVAAAARASKQYALFAPTARAEFLRCIGQEIVALGDTLVDRCCAETGLPRGRIVSERGRTVAQLGLFADLIEEGSWVDARIDTALPERAPLPRPDLRRMLRPLGPVAVFGSSNFPLAFSVAGGDSASAFAAGNAVVVKAHPSHPGTSELVGEAIRRAVARLALPPEVFSLLHGASHRVGEILIRQPALRAVGFTGSATGGRALHEVAAARAVPIPVFAEMGSTNPVFLLPGALVERSEEIAAGIAASATLGAGQFCTQPGLVFGLASEEFSTLIDATVRALADAPGGTMLSEPISRRYRDGVERLSATQGLVKVFPPSQGGALDARGVPDTNTPAAEVPETATFGRTAAFVTDATEFLSNRELHREVFGPVTLFVRAESTARLLQLIQALDGQLTATLHATEADLQEYGELPAALSDKVGRLIWNGFPTGVEVCHAMHHGGPYPATTAEHFTSVGSAAILRFARPICYQNLPDAALPAELQRANPRAVQRLLNGRYTRDPG